MGDFKLHIYRHFAKLRPRYINIIKDGGRKGREEERGGWQTRVNRQAYESLGSLGKPLPKSLHRFNNWSQFWHPPQFGIIPYFFFFLGIQLNMKQQKHRDIAKQ